MKKTVYIFLVLTQLLFSQNGFDRGNELYQKGNYNEAVKAYEDVLTAKKHSAELYFNIGNCYYNLTS